MPLGGADRTVPTDGVKPSAATRALGLCREQGFALTGVCDARPTDRGDELRTWLAEGKHGEMGYLAEHLDARLNPDLVLEGARSAIVVADLYHTRDASPDVPEPGRGRVARYARGRDYHASIKKRLHAACDVLQGEHPGHTFRAFTDTAPVMERELAARAGIGWTGKHTLTINPRLGSWFFLGGILTTLELEPPPDQPAVEDHCGTCTRCIDACPTDAITPYSIDARRCISYLTIEHRSRIEPVYFERMGDWIAGCDICQEVCPHNSARPSPDPALAHSDYAPRGESFDLLKVLGWTAEDRAEAFRGSALKRIRLDMIRRNALVAAANAWRDTGEVAYLEAVRAAAHDEAELVRTTARDLLDDLDLPAASPE